MEGTVVSSGAPVGEVPAGMPALVPVVSAPGPGVVVSESGALDHAAPQDPQPPQVQQVSAAHAALQSVICSPQFAALVQVQPSSLQQPQQQQQQVAATAASVSAPITALALATPTPLDLHTTHEAPDPKMSLLKGKSLSIPFGAFGRKTSI